MSRSSNNIFGDKVIVLGGDFRQVRLVVPSVLPAAVLDASFKHSSTWENVHQMQLTQVMKRNANIREFSGSLLKLESSIDKFTEDIIDIPYACMSYNSLVFDIYEEKKIRMIVSPKILNCLAVDKNRFSIFR